MEEVKLKYKKWKKEHPDGEYQWDCIFDFVDNLSRTEMYTVMESLITPNTIKEEE